MRPPTVSELAAPAAPEARTGPGGVGVPAHELRRRIAGTAEGARVLETATGGLAGRLEPLETSVPALLSGASETLTPLIESGGGFAQSLLGPVTAPLPNLPLPSSPLITSVLPNAAAASTAASPILAPQPGAAAPTAARESASYRAAEVSHDPPAGASHARTTAASTAASRHGAASHAGTWGEAPRSSSGSASPSKSAASWPPTSPGGAATSVAATGGGGTGFSIFLIFAGLLAMAAPWTTRMLQAAGKPLRPAPFVLLPERPG